MGRGSEKLLGVRAVGACKGPASLGFSQGPPSAASSQGGHGKLQASSHMRGECQGWSSSSFFYALRTFLSSFPLRDGQSGCSRREKTPTKLNKVCINNEQKILVMRDWFLQTRGMLTGVRLAATEEATSPGAELEVPSRRPHLPGRRGTWSLLAISPLECPG